MKKITFLFALLTVSLGFSQILPFDFENPNQAFTGFDGATSGIVDDAGNGVLLLDGTTTPSGASCWDNAQFQFSQVIDLSGVSDAERTVSFRIKSVSGADGVTRNMGVQFFGGAGGNSEQRFTIPGNNGVWEDVDVIMPPGGQKTTMLFFIDMQLVDGACNGIQSIYYVDDITTGASFLAPSCSDGLQNGSEEGIDCGGSCDPCASPPAAPATTPTRDSGDVLSIYSGAYTAAPTDGVPLFGGATSSEISISSNSTIELVFPNPGGGFQYQYFSNPALDLTNYTLMHIDFYVSGTPSVGSEFQVILQNFGGVGGAFEHNIIQAFDVNSLATDTWHEMDVSFGDFSSGGALSRNAIKQIQIVGAGPVFSPVYIDNIYFYDDPTAGVDDFGKNTFKVFPNPTQDSWTVKTQSASISSIRVFDVLGKNVLSLSPNRNEATIDGTSLNKGLYFAQIETASGISSLKLIKQ